MRRRTKDRHLPACVYFKHGAYYLVREGKWTRLAREFPAAMQEYARLADTDGGDMVTLMNTVLSNAAQEVKPNTLKQYRLAAERIKEAFVNFRASDVQPKHIHDFMQHWRATPNFANRMRSLLKAAMTEAAAKGMREDNPVVYVDRFKERKRTRYLEDWEWDAIYAQGSPALRCMMDIAYYTAQRIGDVLAIRRSDVTDEGIIFRQEKTGARLLVESSPALDAAIRRAKALHRTDPLYLLGQKNGKIRSYKGARDLLRRAAIRAGVEDVGWHDIRARSITDAKRQGLDAQALAGHTNQAQTQRYLRGKETPRVRGPSFRQSGTN